MGSLQLCPADGPHLHRPLAAITTLGRHPSCTWQLDSPSVPLFWLEVRWTGSGWSWRALADAERTRGPIGRSELGEGWNRLDIGARRVRGVDVDVLLADGTPPHRFAVDLLTGDVVEGAPLDDALEERADGVWPADAERFAHVTRPLADGEPVVIAGRTCRLHLADRAASTERGEVDLQLHTARVALDHDDGEWRISVMDGSVCVSLSSAAVRIAVPYALARQRDIPLGGWLQVDDVYEQWLELGGASSSGPERVGQDRSRLCRALASAGVANAHHLFATRVVGGRRVSRFEPSPSRLEGVQPSWLSEGAD